jgi:hypothetical protein
MTNQNTQSAKTLDRRDFCHLRPSNFFRKAAVTNPEHTLKSSGYEIFYPITHKRMYASFKRTT